MPKFKACIEIIGINPFVFVPENILQKLFKQNNKDKGPIPIRGTINDKPYQQTLIKYKGAWRLYINTFMLEDSPRRVGEIIKLTIEFDPADRTLTPHPKLTDALINNPRAQKKFDDLSPSLQKEIVRYISFLKTEGSVDKNVTRAINFLLGKERFIGREPMK
ncbi:MAG TPA: YdeI/OmpD-associated family protein [Flavipsychrobacter sp.]|nr:YdeI/OmpD-associated family protein [Flavipsychrobacter sp.]